MNSRQDQKAELSVVWRIAIPLIVANLAEYAMFLSIKIIVGKLGYEELAAVGLATDLAFEAGIILMGLLSVVGVLAAHALGEKKPVNAGLATHQGMILATLIAIPAAWGIFNLPAILEWTGQDPRVVEIATPYTQAQALFIIPLLWFTVLRSFVTAYEDTRIVFYISLGAVLITYPLTYALVHGKFGLSAMGVAGAGRAIAIVNALMFIALLLWTALYKRYRESHLWPLRFKPDFNLQWELLGLGLPVALLVMLEAGLFIAVSILSGVIGTDELAAYQIVMSWLGIPFVIAHALSNAIMVRVAFHTGRKDPVATRWSGLLGISSSLIFMTVLLAIPLLIPDAIINLFLSPEDPGYQRISELVKSLLIIVVCFQLFDALQVLSAYALRGLRDTLYPLFIASIGYWVIGICGGAWLAFRTTLGIYGLWTGLALGLFVTGLLLFSRFYRLTHPRKLNLAV